ncbi:MAG: aromatic ring-hydroxylating dioxygenase subunit alpha [Microcystis wesenbergii Mw_MB_S_20031200_S109D]|jgi:phenylpropionate dioxygenase-like ring-hydroxylating dioxygenase large terminal subunit|uniref:Aromatic ring-hydroxylating dioxygenase subunit alpha n=1 Tax=Microcystis wesenbergii Mw_MB_S_20031200_S109D TaxID=2486241 RepID=A0A552LDZ7_9CHRO|nr:MAG: aromatic ring-hydroxylating dioxygenase subunit alpha [Microcystis wesenbergii Mw_MB_S_20031200_S109D]
MNNVINIKSIDTDWDWLVQDYRVHSSIYTSDSIFTHEMSHVFAATWVYLLHESEIPNVGDFRQVWMGTREFIATRDDSGKVNVFANRCSHRGATVCREHRGNGSGFTCPYHGWKYDNQGQLFGIPGKTAYGPEFKKRPLNLARPAQVASYKGFVFATLNPDVPALEDHLGGARRYLDEWIAHQGGADNIVVSGAQRFHLECNWKMVYDNAGDGYHVPFSHQSLLVMTNERYGGGDMSYFADADRSNMHLYSLGNGHTVIDQRPDMFLNNAWEQQRPQPGRENFEKHVQGSVEPDKVKATLESAVGAGMNLNIFPNLLLIGNQIQVIQPLRAAATAMHWYATRRKDADAELNTMRMRTQEDFPVMGEMDDATNFEECHRGIAISPEDEWIDISRHVETGKDVLNEDGLMVGPVTSELHMRAYYAQWKQLMKANPTLSVNKSKVEA